MTLEQVLFLWSKKGMGTENICAVEKRGRVYVITLTGEGEHRLNPALLSAIRAAVAAVRAFPRGAGALVLASTQIRSVNCRSRQRDIRSGRSKPAATLETDDGAWRRP